MSWPQSRPPFPLHTNAPAPFASRRIIPEFRPTTTSQTNLRSADKSSKNVPTSHVVSITSALFLECSQLIENASLSPTFKSFNFSRLRTLFHSSPASPVFSVCSQKHTGGIPHVAQSSRIADTVAPSKASGCDLFVLRERRFRFFAVHIAHRTICNFRGPQCLMP